MSSMADAEMMAQTPYGFDYSCPPRRLVSEGSVTIASLPGDDLESLVDSPVVSILAPGVGGIAEGGVVISASEFVTLSAGRGCGLEFVDSMGATGEVTMVYPSTGMLTIRSEDFLQSILMTPEGIMIEGPSIILTAGALSVAADKAVEVVAAHIGLVGSTSVDGQLEVNGEATVNGAAVVKGGLVVA